MEQQTNPQAGVLQETDVMQRMQNFLSQSDDQGDEERRQQDPNPAQQGAHPVEQPTDQASDELTPDDLEVESQPQEQSAVEAFEIVHNGQQVKLSREEAIKYAMQGFDATRKTQAAAEQYRQAGEQLRVLSQLQQVHPQLLQKQAQVAALESQLAQWQNFNWVKLANDDPVGYAPARAQYDTLVAEYNRARHEYGQFDAGFKQQMQGIYAQRAQAEYARLPELIPEWGDAAKRTAGETELAKHFADSYGVSVQELSQFLGGSALALATAYKAMKYDRLLKGKKDKVGQLRSAPPVPRPGAAQSQQSLKGDKTKQLQDRLKKTGDVKDAAALLLNRMG